MSFIKEQFEKLSHWVNPGHKKYIYELSEGSINDEKILSRKGIYSQKDIEYNICIEILYKLILHSSNNIILIKLNIHKYNIGAYLCELHRLGYAVPPAIILTSEVSNEYLESENKELRDIILNDIKIG